MQDAACEIQDSRNQTQETTHTMSNVEQAKKTWGEREGVTLELLGKFTKPGCERLGKVLQNAFYRGDFTETGDRRLRAAMGEEAYEHLHWDAVACNGGVLVVVPRWKFGTEDRNPLGLDAPYWWAMSAIAGDELEEGAGIRPSTAKEIAEVVSETRELLSLLPGLEFMHVAKLSFYSTNKPGKKQWREAPGDVRLFRFAAGYGLVAIREGAGKDGDR